MASEARSVGMATRRVPLQPRDGNVAAASPSSVDVMGEAARALLRPWRSPSTSTAGPSSQPPPPVHHRRFHPGRFPSSSPPRFDRNYTSSQLVYGVWFGAAQTCRRRRRRWRTPSGSPPSATTSDPPRRWPRSWCSRGRWSTASMRTRLSSTPFPCTSARSSVCKFCGYNCTECHYVIFSQSWVEHEAAHVCMNVLRYLRGL